MLVLIFFTQPWELYGARILIQRLSCQKCRSLGIGLWSPSETPNTHPRKRARESTRPRKSTQKTPFGFSYEKCPIPSRELTYHRDVWHIWRWFSFSPGGVSPLNFGTFELMKFSHLSGFPMGYGRTLFPGESVVGKRCPVGPGEPCKPLHKEEIVPCNTKPGSLFFFLENTKPENPNPWMFQQLMGTKISPASFSNLSFLRFSGLKLSKRGRFEKSSPASFSQEGVGWNSQKRVGLRNLLQPVSSIRYTVCPFDHHRSQA